MSCSNHKRLVIVDGDGMTVVPPPPHHPMCKVQGLEVFNQECDGCLYDYYARRIRELVVYELTEDAKREEESIRAKKQSRS